MQLPNMWSQLSLLVLLCGLAASARIHQYKGFKVYEVIPRYEEQTRFLYELSMKTDKFDFWALARTINASAVVMVAPQFQNEFEEVIHREKLPFIINNQDLSKSLYTQRPTISPRSLFQKADFTKFLRFNEINDYLDVLAGQYPDTVTVETVGTSFEGRDLKTITISNGDKRPDKKVIFIDAGIHAREWIAPAAAVYVIYQLAENAEANQHLLKNIEWKILPVVNPDGYEYTHVNDRFWRKTRQPNQRCVGTDGNRNFDFHWGEVGTSDSGCDDIYHGPKAFSEPETRTVRKIMESVSDRCKMYLTLHSFGSYLLYPWGWTDALPSTWKDIDEVAMAGANAISTSTGGRYQVGSSTNLLYPAAGGSDDYALGVLKIPVALTMELPSGGSGFDPNPKDILWMVKETWVGIEAMAKKVDKKYV